jgi:septal ring factor EnvC (AmiA/AmiB activator)
MRATLRISSLAILTVIYPALCATAHAAGVPGGDWPCVQREMPHISAGMVWTGGEIDPNDKSWSNDAAVAPKVAEIGSRRKSAEDAIALIDKFAADLKDNRTTQLKLLFTGVLQRLNAERDQIMNGIKRFAHKQTALADLIKQSSAELEALSRKPSLTEEEKRKRTELQEQLSWDERIYDERRKSLRYVCETPVELEKRMFQIGRHVSELISKK